MDNLISRKAATELADNLKDDLPDDERMADAVMAHNEGILDYQTALSLLPSAQPKIIRCKDCVHYHTDVFGGELGLSGIWKNIIVAHNACDKWTKDMNCVTPDGFCFLAERRVENADVNT